MRFGKYLQKLRKEKDMSQLAFSVQVGISQSYLSAIERESALPPRKHIIRQIAQTLEIDENVLLDFANDVPGFRTRGHITEEAKRKISIANKGRTVSAETREKQRKAKLLSESMPAILARARQKRWSKHIHTECGFCGVPGPDEQKSVIRYEDEQKDFALCAACFGQWQAKPDEAVVISGRGQEQSA